MPARSHASWCGHDLVGEEAPEAVAEQVVLVVEEGAFHRPTERYRYACPPVMRCRLLLPGISASLLVVVAAAPAACAQDDGDRPRPRSSTTTTTSHHVDHDDGALRVAHAPATRRRPPGETDHDDHAPTARPEDPVAEGDAGPRRCRSSTTPCRPRPASGRRRRRRRGDPARAAGGQGRGAPERGRRGRRPPRRVDDLSSRLADAATRARPARRRPGAAPWPGSRRPSERFEERVANAVVRGNAAELDTIISSQDANEVLTRKTFLATVTEADTAAVREYQAAKDVVDAGVLDADRRRGRHPARAARRPAPTLESSSALNAERRFQLAVFSAGSEIVIRGFVFPVGEPYTLRRQLGLPPDDRHRVRARPPGHRHHGAVRDAALRHRAGHRDPGGHRRARRHEAVAQGPVGHVLLLRPPQSLRRGHRRGHAGRGRRRSSASWATPATPRAAPRTCTSRSIPAVARP